MTPPPPPNPSSESVCLLICFITYGIGHIITSKSLIIHYVCQLWIEHLAIRNQTETDRWMSESINHLTWADFHTWFKHASLRHIFRGSWEMCPRWGYTITTRSTSLRYCCWHCRRHYHRWRSTFLNLSFRALCGNDNISHTDKVCHIYRHNSRRLRTMKFCRPLNRPQIGVLIENGFLKFECARVCVTLLILLQYRIHSIIKGKLLAWYESYLLDRNVLEISPILKITNIWAFYSPNLVNYI